MKCTRNYTISRNLPYANTYPIYILTSFFQNVKIGLFWICQNDFSYIKIIHI